MVQAFEFPIAVKSKVKLSHYRPCRHEGGEEYSSYSFLTSALDGGHPLLPGKIPHVPTGQEAGWALETVWTQRLEEK
jgi:hypothetical protein